jgi:orotidine-5'-phosphate decarboxylase
MKKQPIFVAVDTNNYKRASEIINATKNYIYGVKFGLEFFCTKGGREAIKKFKKKNKKIKIFLDNKFLDIPNTVYKAIKSLKDISPDYLTIHASGGLEMMKSAKKAQSETNKKMKIFAVTTLTSLTNKDLKQMGSNTKVETQVQKLAQTARLAKIHGIVCSAHEISKVKKISKNFEIIVPGIRISNKVQDQKRVMGPKQALKLGATHLVIGRDITKGNPKTNIKKVLNALI